MGNSSCHEQMMPPIQYPPPSLTINKPILSPDKSYAVQLKEASLEKLCGEVLSLAERVKTQQKFEGVVSKVQACPIYYILPLNCLYQGQWKDQLPHGCGIAVYKNNSYYEGEFNLGDLDSKDALYLFGTKLEAAEIQQTKTELSKTEEKKQTDVKSTYYIGGFVNSKFNGKGKMHHRGVIYDGDWEDGRRQGEGTEYDVHRTYTYKGPYANGFKYGHEALYQCKINGNLCEYEGAFYCGLFHGKGLLKVAGKDHYKGSFLNGRAEGQGELFCHIGVLTCNFSRDRVQGMGQFKFNDQSKDSLMGEFKDEIFQNAQSHKLIRRIILDKTEIAEAEFIDFRSLMVDI